MGNIDIARETYHQPATRHRREHPVARALGLGLAGVFAIYLLGRGIAEFFVIHYSDPASYRNDWGGPSLAGVFAVHSGPAVAIMIASVIYLRRRWLARRRPAA